MQEIKNYLSRHGFECFKPKLFLFDMDGVLYDSMSNHAIAWQKSMASCGIDMKYDEAYTYEGMRGVETIKLLARRQWGREITDVQAEEMYAKKAAEYSKLTVAGLIPNVHRLQEILISKGIRIGVVTGSGQPSLINRILLDFKGLVSPDIIVSARDVMCGKPMPDPYLVGMSKGDAKPFETIVVENAPLGIRAGVAAKCFTIGVNTGPLPDSDLYDAGADLVLPDMSSVIDVVDRIPISI